MFNIDLFRKYLVIYRQNPLRVKLHVIVRLLTCPFSEIEKFMPKKGVVLDFGCGYGCFAHYLHLTSSGRTIVACDTAEDKITQAAKTVVNNKNMKFYTGTADRLDNGSFDCISIIDVLYLVPLEEWRIIFERCHSLLSNGGIFLLKEMDKEPSWKFRWNNFQETLSVKIFKVTSGSSFRSNRSFYFKGQDELCEELAHIGFKVTAVRIDKGYLHPHILYVCIKN
ncbi:MAG: class I SAM-dependent methyltransferase [Candidatus Omnitrophica bacterium]|nr:class I SAM-dependent methyltransferase [Candidatus Omnitrophota bacterium]